MLCKSAKQRFEDNHVSIPESGCWLWIGYLNTDGYGQFSVNGKKKLSHRYAYEQKYGLIPKGLELDHKCRVRCCANPDHVEPVTHKTNLNRGICGNSTRKKKIHCPRGHLYSSDNIYINPNNGKQQCRICQRQHVIDYRLRQKTKSTA